MHYVLILYVLYKLIRALLGGREEKQELGRVLARVGRIVLFAGLYGATVVGLVSLVGAEGSGLRILAAMLLPFPLLLAGHHWLVWRWLGPLGAVGLGRGVLWLAPFWRQPDRPGARALFTELYRPSPAAPVSADQEWASPWTAIARIVSLERSGDLSRAESLAAGLAALPAKAWGSRRLRHEGIEALAVSAARRGDWPAVARRSVHGCGRRLGFLRRLARFHQNGGGAPSGLLRVLAWLAPGRAENRAWLDAAAAPSPPLSPPLSARGELPWQAHLVLLARATSATPPPMTAVAALAAGWEEPLAAAGQGRCLARGLELETRAPAEVFHRLRESIVADLQGLMELADGRWPDALVPADGPDEDEETESWEEDEEERELTLAEELALHHRNRLFERIRRRSAAFLGSASEDQPARPGTAPLAEWEEWMSLRRDVERLEAFAGFEAVETAWYTGLRIAACNWPVELEQGHGIRAKGATYGMHLWSAELAGRVGDEEIVKLSRNNAKLTLRTLSSL